MTAAAANSEAVTSPTTAKDTGARQAADLDGPARGRQQARRAPGIQGLAKTWSPAAPAANPPVLTARWAPGVPVICDSVGGNNTLDATGVG